jgi:pimeloyl-ACP methyl ester carboxylesterase
MTVCLKRRAVLACSFTLVLTLLGDLSGQGTSAKRTFVIVHGAWGGGWDWRGVSDLLTARGHVVFRPTLTGLGERAHLASPEIGLQTHINDVANTILYENLREVTLVGHSYGGMVVTGVADQIPDRIAHLAYIDAFVPFDGESVMDLLAARGSAKPPGAIQGAFVVPTWVKPGTLPPIDVPQPLKTFTDAIVLKNELRERIPTTYIHTVAKEASKDDFDLFAARARKKGWQIDKLTADHTPERSAPGELSALLEHVR